MALKMCRRRGMCKGRETPSQTERMKDTHQFCTKKPIKPGEEAPRCPPSDADAKKTKGYPAKTPINRPQWQRTAAPPHTPNTAPPTDGIMRERESKMRSGGKWGRQDGKSGRWYQSCMAKEQRGFLYVHKSRKKESYEMWVQETSRKVKAVDKIWVHDRRHAWGETQLRWPYVWAEMRWLEGALLKHGAEQKGGVKIERRKKK